MTFGSLFSGIGGIDLGLERVGMECRWQVEIDPWCRRVLAKHWPDVKRYEDVRDVGADNLEAVDLIAGGFPCQPFSLAGQRRGEGDDRNLWPEMRCIVEDLRPRWVLAENVPGIISLYLDTVLSDLEALGYTTGALVLPACAFDAPHIRQRLFIVANAASERCGSRRPEPAGQQRQAGATDGGEDVADADRERQLQQGWRFEPVGRWTSDGSQDVADAEGKYGERPVGEGDSDWESEAQVGDGGGLVQDALRAGRIAERPIKPRTQSRTGPFGELARSDWWAVEPNVGRVAYGIPARVDRLRALGNAVVPQVIEFIGRQIVEAATCKV